MAKVPSATTIRDLQTEREERQKFDSGQRLVIVVTLIICATIAGIILGCFYLATRSHG